MIPVQSLWILLLNFLSCLCSCHTVFTCRCSWICGAFSPCCYALFLFNFSCPSITFVYATAPNSL